MIGIPYMSQRLTRHIEKKYVGKFSAGTKELTLSLQKILMNIKSTMPPLQKKPREAHYSNITQPPKRRLCESLHRSKIQGIHGPAGPPSGGAPGQVSYSNHWICNGTKFFHPIGRHYKLKIKINAGYVLTLCSYIYFFCF